MLSLVDVIQQLREDIAQAQITAVGSDVQFEVVEVEVELLVEFREEAGPSGKINIGVASIGADAKSSNATSHRVKLKLDALDAQQQRKVRVGERADRPWSG